MRSDDSDPTRESGVMVVGAEILDRAREVSRRVVERVRQVVQDTDASPDEPTNEAPGLA